MAEAAFQMQLSEGGLGINHLASFVDVGSHFTPCLPASSCRPPPPPRMLNRNPGEAMVSQCFPGNKDVPDNGKGPTGLRRQARGWAGEKRSQGSHCGAGVLVCQTLGSSC